jgi:putative ABC transport system ATP-binding protein
MGKLVLEIKDVSNGILEDVNLEVGKGDFFLILGPSGSGKSTLLNLICRMEPLASGQILINGVDIYSISDFDKWKAANIGYIYEKNNLISTFTVYENVELPMLADRGNKGERRERVLGALEIVGLREKERFYPNKLKMEEKQRVALARSIVIDPVIILADEPTGKLKKDQTEGFIGLMGELNKKTGSAFVVVSHDPSLKSVASKVLEL